MKEGLNQFLLYTDFSKTMEVKEQIKFNILEGGAIQGHSLDNQGMTITGLV